METIKDLPDQAFQTFDHVLFPVWVFSVETLQIIAANQATQDWLGFDLQTLKSMTIADLRPENERTRIVEEIKKFTGAKKDAGVWTIIGKDGERNRANFSWSRARFNGANVIVASILDTKKMAAADTLVANLAANLQRELQRRQLASRLVRLGSWQYKIGEPNLFWDNETAAIHDEPEGISPSVENGVSYYIPEDQDRIRRRFEACVHDGIPFDEVCQILTAKGRTVWVRAFGEPIRDQTGSVVGVNGAFQDISELIASCEALRHAASNFGSDERWLFSFG